MPKYSWTQVVLEQMKKIDKKVESFITHCIHKMCICYYSSSPRPAGVAVKV